MDHSEYGINWYAIQVRPRAEFSTANILLSKGLEPYVPQYRATRQWSDRQVKVDLPLFPGYVFCRFDATIQLPIYGDLWGSAYCWYKKNAFADRP